MAVVLVSGDLMGASRVEGAARLSGVEYQMVGTIDAAIDACAATPVLLVAVDLATADIDVTSLVQRLRHRSENVPTIAAYGPHVHEAVLQRAKEAGCDLVLSRGQFMSQIESILAEYATARK
jgi:DNA-binding response OmpR family regulator